MTLVRLIRPLKREVVRPLLRAKRDLLRAIVSGGPSRHPGDVTAAPDERTARPAAAPAPSARQHPGPWSGSGSDGPAGAPGAAGRSQAAKRTKADLYEEAVRRDIPGRSTMNKAQLEQALGLDDARSRPQ